MWEINACKMSQENKIVIITPSERLNTDSFEAQCIVMLEEHEEREDRSGNIVKFHNNEFYVAIMDEDLESIEDMLKQHGNNFLIEVQDSTPGKVFWKVNTIIPTFLELLVKLLNFT